MPITPQHRDHFEELLARLIRARQTPIALCGGGHTCEALRPALRPGGQHIACVIDDNPAKHHKTVGGVECIPFEAALARGIKSVVITAEGNAQDALWSARARFRKAGLYVLTAPPRFASKSWDAALIDQYEHALGEAGGGNAAYLHNYPIASPPRPHEMIDAILSRLPQGATVCEIGAGTGLCTQHILPNAGRYHIVDFSQRLLHEVIEHRFAAHADRMHLHHDETATLAGVPDASIDVLFSYDVFVHFKPDLVHQFLAAAARVLKPGGRALLHFAKWNPAALASWNEHQRAAHIGTGSIVHYNHPEWLAVSAVSLGLRCEPLFDMNRWQFVCEFRRG